MSRSLAVKSPSFPGSPPTSDEISPLSSAKFVPLTREGRSAAIIDIPLAQPTEKILEQLSSCLGKTLTLSEIIAGKGADPRNEIFNYEYGGADIIDSAGNQYQLLYWIDPTQGEDAALGLSLTSITNGQESWVSTYRLKDVFSGIEATVMSQRILHITELLGDPSTFEEGLSNLDMMKQANCLDHELFELTVEVPRFSAAQFESELGDWLRRKEVPVDSWGRGEAKTISCLAKEILTGEGELSFENGDVYLSNRVVMLWVETPDGSKRIIELCQEFTDGRPFDERIRVRRNLGGLLAEKIRPDEDPRQAVLRGLREELGISQVLEIEDQNVSRRLERSMCFPGIIKRNLYHVFRVVIPPSEEKPRYKETSPGKNTYFGWISV